jgi:hypothetical protein
VIDYQKLDTFRASVTKYKFIAHFQARFLVHDDGLTFAGPPTVLQADVEVGQTRNPCGDIIGVPCPVPAQTGPATTSVPVVPTSNQRLTMIADASPDADAVRAFDALTAAGVVDFEVWENVGCRIRFWANGGTSPDLTFQPFPSYYVYRNGGLVSVTPQVPIRDHFYGPADANYPVYPFGQVSWTGAAGVPIPDSRCGNAVSPADSTARVPAYTIP